MVYGITPKKDERAKRKEEGRRAGKSEGGSKIEERNEEQRKRRIEDRVKVVQNAE
jgi:hypothetical protein